MALSKKHPSSRVPLASSARAPAAPVGRLSPVIVVQRETAWSLLRDLSRRANRRGGVVSRVVRRMTPTAAALELYHGVGLELGFVARLSAEALQERGRALLEYGRGRGFEGIEALLLGAIFSAIERGDRRQAAEGAKLFDGWRRRGGKVRTGCLPVLDRRGELAVFDGLGLAELGLGDIVSGVGDRSDLGSRLPNFRPGPALPGSSTGKVSGGAAGVSVDVFGSGALIEVSVNGHGTDIVVGTVARGAAIGGLIGLGPVGLAVGSVAGAIIGIAAAIYDWVVGQEVEKMKADISAQLERTAKELKEYQEQLRQQDEADRRRREEEEKKNNNNNDDNDDDDDDDADDGGDDPDGGDQPDDGGDAMPGWDGDDRSISKNLSPRDLARIFALIGELHPQGPSDGPDDDPTRPVEGGVLTGVDLVAITLDPAIDYSPEADPMNPPRIEISWREIVKRFTSDGSDYNADGIPAAVPGVIGEQPAIGGGFGPEVEGTVVTATLARPQRSRGRLRYSTAAGDVSVIMGE